MSSKSQLARNQRTLTPDQFRRKDLFYGCSKCPDFRIDRLKDTAATVARRNMTLEKHVREKHPEIQDWMSLKTRLEGKTYYGPSTQVKVKKMEEKSRSDVENHESPMMEEQVQAEEIGEGGNGVQSEETDLVVDGVQIFEWEGIQVVHNFSQ